MHVDGPRQTHHPVDHRAAGQLRPARPPAGAEDELGGVLCAGELHEGGGDVVAGGLVVGAAHLLQQPALVVDGLAAAHQPVVGPHVHAQQLAVRPTGDAARPPHQCVSAGGSGDGHDHPLACLPGLGDAVALAVLLERIVDAVGHPQQCQLPQGREVAGAEVVGEGGVDLLGGVDVAVRQAPAQSLGGHVHQLDLVGGPDDLVGQGLPLLHAGDPLDHVVDRLEVLDVDRRDHVDAGVEQHLDVLPALGVARARHVGVRQLVDQRHVRPPGEHGVEIHLLEGGPPVLDHVAGDHLDFADLLGGVRPAVRLDVADHDVGAALLAAAALVEHGERLAHARRGPEVDA